MASKRPRERLAAIVSKNRYLDLEHHSLHPLVKDARDAIKSGTGDADDLLNRIESELESEERTLAAAFKKFDHNGSGALTKVDMTAMSSYLGFPSQESDIEKLMNLLDEDGTGDISFPEFCSYVGTMGGVLKLFEERRRRMAEQGGEASADDPEQLRLSLKEAGIDDEAQAYWNLVVPQSEFSEAGKLVNCQREALSHIRNLARSSHEKALPLVQKRVLNMGFKDENLWMTLAWIRECAPVIVHLNLDKMLQFLESDTHYRNQFETASSGGLLKPAVREKWEKDLFGGRYDTAKGFDRCKYGVLNVMNDYRGVVKCKQYGTSYMVLKDSRLRCTFSPEDSANLKADRLAVLDFYAHVLNEYSDAELQETLSIASDTSDKGKSLGDSSKVGAMKYKESQIHGAVAFEKHVERFVAHTDHRGDADVAERIQAVCAKHGWAFSWMDEEEARMKAEDESKMKVSTWEERLAMLERSGASAKVPDGFCKIGCGREVCPGTTRAGKPFTTCCKGCVMGFGHDFRCGQVDPSKVGPGLCKNGCGKKVAPGKDSKGRRLDTCCRGCTMGMAHDKNCGLPPKATGRLCNKGCTRGVAPGVQKNGKPFSTCCRDCAMGKGHSPGCIEPPADDADNADPGDAAEGELPGPPDRARAAEVMDPDAPVIEGEEPAAQQSQCETCGIS